MPKRYCKRKLPNNSVPTTLTPICIPISLSAYCLFMYRKEYAMSIRNLLKAVLNALLKTYGREKALKLFDEIVKLISQ